MITSATDANTWDTLVSSLPRAQFTQSWAWGAFRESRGQEIVRLIADDAAALFFKVPAPVVGGYWYAPRGPVGKSPDAIKKLVDAIIREKSLPGRALFWRVEPPVEAIQLPNGFIQSHAYMPATTLLVNLTQSEDALQRAMHEKTRYNIRVAERKGVTVRTATDRAALNTFVRLTEETAVRDQFRSQPADYIRATFEALVPAGMVRIRIAEKEGTALAASFEITYGDTVTYLYGASSSTERNAMAPYALHWNAMADAKQHGYRFYDFHGVNPADETSPYFKRSWEGITRFKTGWGGERVNYMGTWELPRITLPYKLLRLISH